jgi:hypothetical protein
MSGQMHLGPGGGMWCREHGCYHAGLLDVTSRIALAAVKRVRKLTTRQAKNYGLEMDGDIVFIPQRSRRSPSGWEIVRFRWRMDGKQLRLDPPNETTQQGQS